MAENEAASTSRVEIVPTGNVLADMAAIEKAAAEIDAAKAQTQQAEAIPTQTQGTEQPQGTEPQAAAEAQPAQPATLEIPKKFANPDGTVNESALQKATLDAEAALGKYRQMEKELKQRMNAVHNQNRLPLNAQPVQQAQPQQQVQQQAEPPKTFAEAVELSVKERGLGVTMEELTRIAEENAYRRAMRDVEGIKEESEWQKKERELRVIMERHPELMTEDTINALSKTIEANPYLQAAPNPWTAALKMHLGDKEFHSNRSTGQPQGISPTPKGPTAPVAPVGPATIPQAQGTPNFSKMDPEAVRQAARNMKADDLAKVLNSMGVHLGR